MNKLEPTKLKPRKSAECKQWIKDCTTKLGMTRKQARDALKAGEPDAMFVNDKYVVCVFKNEPNGFPPDVGDIWHLSIRRQDREAWPDWRDFQQIKNEICGTECEGLELYPAQSRVMDSANQYHIYVFMQPAFMIPVGYTDTHPDAKRDGLQIGNSKQRPFK